MKKFVKQLIVYFFLILPSLSLANISVVQNHFDNKQYDQVIIQGEKLLRTTPIKEQSQIYYLIGKAQAELGFYESSLVSLELASDLSSDSILDHDIDREIDYSIRRQQVFESARLKNKLILTLGSGYDSNVLNVNDGLYTSEDLQSVSAIYGFTYSRKIHNSVESSVIPEFSLQDNYSLNSSLESNSTVQSNDALIWSLSVPYIQYRQIVHPNDQVKYKITYQNVYLPTSDSKRSLSYVSIGFVNEYQLAFSSWYVLVPSFGISNDSHQTATDSSSDATATRLNFKFNNLFNLTSGGDRRAGVLIEYTNNNARSDSSFYNRFTSKVGYEMDWKYDATLGTSLKYQISNYSKSDPVRTDNLVSLDAEFGMPILKGARIGSILSIQNNASTSDSYDYADNSLALFYNQTYDF